MIKVIDVLFYQKKIWIFLEFMDAGPLNAMCEHMSKEFEEDMCKFVI